MIYYAYSLGGAWEMSYRKTAYHEAVDPWSNGLATLCGSATVENAVPGYWEDMTEAFSYTPFYRHLQINPEYGIQQYPMAGSPGDMALPNLLGNFFYRRTFSLSDIGRPTVLHFEGVQNRVSAWINGVYLGSHAGYCTPFELPVPDGALREGENTVSLSVSNERLHGYMDEPISGITSRAANEGTGGITGELELRVYRSALRDISIRVSEDCSAVTVLPETVGETELLYEVCDGDRILKSGRACGTFSFDTERLLRWSPEQPKLYTLRVLCGDGALERRFGVRRLTADGPHLRLNGIPYYLRGICEHCYFPDTVHPAHDLLYYRSIIRRVKELGFNFIRFHTYIPEEEYMQAADELGILLHVESPNNTTLAEWGEIVRFCRRHSSVVIYCCGNELQMDDSFIAHLALCSETVHRQTDALFSPMSALRGLEYAFPDPGQEAELVEEPFRHHPRRFREVGAFSDLYASYATGQHSYFSLSCDPKAIDERSAIYGDKPRVSHEICIDGTYTDLSLEERYVGTRIGKTDMLPSIRRHLQRKGLLKHAPLYFKNSSEWQRRLRKYCFEAVRRSDRIAGFDFLGPIDTHWHTFGYDVGMMNEFYELKPGETLRNVRMYNSETVLLTDLGKKACFEAGELLCCELLCSCYHPRPLTRAALTVRLLLSGRVILLRHISIESIENGRVSHLFDLKTLLPSVEEPARMTLSVTLDGDGVFAENEWELYLFPKTTTPVEEGVRVTYGMTESELTEAMRNGETVLLLGAAPFPSLPTSFRIGLAGRISGNLATVISDHPALGALPHDGFCSWQFSSMLEGGSAVCFEADGVPFAPIVEVVSTHKLPIRQAALFEYTVMRGRLLVCSLHLSDEDPAARWLRHRLVSYIRSEAFRPREALDEAQLSTLLHSTLVKAQGNSNFAYNANDVTAKRRR